MCWDDFIGDFIKLIDKKDYNDGFYNSQLCYLIPKLWYLWNLEEKDWELFEKYTKEMYNYLKNKKPVKRKISVILKEYWEKERKLKEKNNENSN